MIPCSGRKRQISTLRLWRCFTARAPSGVGDKDELCHNVPPDSCFESRHLSSAQMINFSICVR